MKRALSLGVPLFFSSLVACQSQSLTTTPHVGSSLIPAVTVNDSCSAYTTSTACQSAVGKSVGTGMPANQVCTWTQVEACPAGASCPSGVCVTTSACASLTTGATCQADPNCVWSAILATTSAPALCPVGQDCSGGGFCFDRGSTGDRCLCVQPLACPANGVCPPVQCDCPPPTAVDAGAGSGGGGTCTCGCPACPAGEVCPPCDCTCGTGGSGGTGGGGGTGGCGGDVAGGGSGTGTCTCNCPDCPAGALCPACSCACSDGATTTTTTPSSGAGGASGSGTVSGNTGSTGSPTISVCTCPACPAGAACAPCGCDTPPPADPCTAHTDVASCTADTADACGWTSLAIECITTPCPTGACSQMKPVPPVDAGGGSGSGGCGCACPACAPGEACLPCTCNCCPTSPPQGMPVTLQPQPVAGGGGTASPATSSAL